MISSIRATLPLTESLLPPATPEPRASGVHPSGSAPPVSVTVHAQAVQQAPPKRMAGERQLMEARMNSEASAAALAEAARDAYIKASIAAGISPLPLP